MKFFADTARLSEIEECFNLGINDGITTNPKIMESTGDLSLGFEGACKSILSAYPNTPVSLETDLRGIPVDEIEKKYSEVRDSLLNQAYELSRWGKNVVIKIPFCYGGLLATKELSKQGIKTNVTACMNAFQALSAIAEKATYVSLFANRMLDSNILELSGHRLEEILTNPDWKNIVKNNTRDKSETAWELTLSQIKKVSDQIRENHYESELIIGSIRTPEDICRIVRASPQIITIPYPIAKKLGSYATALKKDVYTDSRDWENVGPLSHPMTQYTLDEFEKAADSYRK